MYQWSWRTWNESSYLTCSLLEPWPHGFFTRQTWPQGPQELIIAVQAEAKPLRVKQVHGNQVLSAAAVLNFLGQQAPDGETWPEADGLYSDARQQALWVCSADCTPVLIGDARTGTIAAIHAGWRGTAAKIVPAAIVQMQKNGSEIADLRVAMGPAISGSVYQVSVEVAAQVGQSVLKDKDLEHLPEQERIEKTVTVLMHQSKPPLLKDEKEGHVRLDVRRVNALQLEQIGLESSQIAISPHCTYQDPDNFFSYRRDSRKQVQWSGIVST